MESELLPPNRASLFDVVEFGEQSLAFITSGKVSVGQLLLMQGQIHIDNQKLPFEATGRVASVQKTDTDQSKLEIDLLQFNKNLWSKFIAAKEETQERIDKIFNSIRGEE